MSVRCNASGVRSSCEALATNWRWAWIKVSNRASRSSKVSPSSFSSSFGPSIARRRCKLVAEMVRAVVVMVRSGRSTRPAMSHTTEPFRSVRHELPAVAFRTST